MIESRIQALQVESLDLSMHMGSNGLRATHHQWDARGDLYYVFTHFIRVQVSVRFVIT